MNFIKLHQNGKELLVNPGSVSEVYTSVSNKSWLYFNFTVEGEQASVMVDESLDEILALIKQESK